MQLLMLSVSQIKKEFDNINFKFDIESQKFTWDLLNINMRGPTCPIIS